MFLVAVCVFWPLLRSDAEESLYKPITNTVLQLPVGVPKTVDTNGNVLNVDFFFTTPEYQEAALDVVIKEANQVACDLALSESQPISRSNIGHAFICPFGCAYTEGGIGNIMTTNYWYNIKRDCRFTDLTIAKYDDYFVKFRGEQYQVPINEMNTNAAYQLATQWLASVHMDVKKLNRDCELHIELTTDMLPGFDESEEKRTRKKITPLYFVSWHPKKKLENSAGSVAYVELFLPTKKLLQLSVNDSKYILRPPIVFTNLEALFPGKGTITTNYPRAPIIIDGSRYGP